MKIRRKQRTHIDLADSGALSDLAFLLIIFFIVIAVFNINKGFLVELPGKDSTRIVKNDDLLKVILTRDNLLEYSGEVISKTEMENKIGDMRRQHPNMTFALIINPDAEYQGVVEIVEMVRKNGIENFSFTMARDDQ